jgi:hypothetical protein
MARSAAPPKGELFQIFTFSKLTLDHRFHIKSKQFKRVQMHCLQRECANGLGYQVYGQESNSEPLQNHAASAGSHFPTRAIAALNGTS